MKIVQFLKQAGVYNEAETAGFDESKPHEVAKAEAFVKAGAARYVELDENGKVKEAAAEQQSLLTPDPFEALKAELNAKPKPELVAYAKEHYEIELKVSQAKAEIVAAIVEEASARAAAAELVANPALDKSLELEAQQQASQVQE
jgi:hypothetical protein